MSINKYFAKVPSFLYLVVCAVFLFAQTSAVLAALITAKVVTDDPMNFEVIWSGNGLDDGESNDALVLPTLTNWQLGPDPITLAYEGGGDGWSGILTVQHIVAPHEGEGFGGNELFNISFDQMADTNSIIDKRAEHDDHADFYTLTYTYVPVDDNRIDLFTATLTGVHVVPLPAPILLFGSALLGFMGLGMKRSVR